MIFSLKVRSNNSQMVEEAQKKCQQEQPKKHIKSEWLFKSISG